MTKPKLVDIETITFFNEINKNIHLKNDLDPQPKPNFTGKFDYIIINIIILSTIILFIYLLYRRHKSKKLNKLIYNHKINKLYNNINNYKDG